MTGTVTINLKVYSPRWGHDDGYELILTQDDLKIKFMGKAATCKWIEGNDPVWESSDGSLFNMFSNDSIYAPEVLPDAMEYAWTRWRSNELDNDEINSEIHKLFEWLNTITQAKPDTEFWKGFF